MNLAPFLSSLRRDPWYIGDVDHDALLSSVEITRGDPDASLFREEQKDPVDEIMSVDDGVATISIHGPLALNVHPLIKAWFGVADFADIRAALARAGADEKVKGVLLDFDTPGGTVRGTPETAEDIHALNKAKPVYAFSEGLMASAGYYLGSQASAIYATPSATLGSIGVMFPFADMSKRAEAMGVKIEVFKSGKFKGAGYPGTSLTDDQRAEIQKRIDSMFSEFRSAVLRGGRAISDDSMQGQTFQGREAVELNVATGTVAGRDDAVARLRRLISLRSS